MSSEIPQREEFVRENKFRVELPDTEQIEEIYDALSHTYQIEPGTFMVGFKIGTSHSEDELFSQINVNAIVVDNAPREGYSIDVNLNYQNPTYSYCPKEQVGQLQGLLTDGYGYSSIDRQTEKD